MERYRYSLLVGRLEREAEDRPKLYAAKVGALAALGYASIILVGVAILVFSYHTLMPLFGEGHDKEAARLWAHVSLPIERIARSNARWTAAPSVVSASSE